MVNYSTLLAGGPYSPPHDPVLEVLQQLQEQVATIAHNQKLFIETLDKMNGMHENTRNAIEALQTQINQVKGLL